MSQNLWMERFSPEELAASLLPSLLPEPNSFVPLALLAQPEVGFSPDFLSKVQAGFLPDFLLQGRVESSLEILLMAQAESGSIPDVMAGQIGKVDSFLHGYGYQKEPVSTQCHHFLLILMEWRLFLRNYFDH